MKLGLDVFSLRDLSWQPWQFLDYAAKLDLDIVQFGAASLESFEVVYLNNLKDRADRLNLSIELGAGSIDKYSASFRSGPRSAEERLNRLLDVAVMFEYPVLGCVLGSELDRDGPVPFEQHVDECVRVLRSVAPRAQDLGIRIALENHGVIDFLARELREVVIALGTEVVGVRLDNGNPAYAAEAPLHTAEVLAPYTLTTHIRDTLIGPVEDGAVAQWVPIGAGNCQIDAVLDLLTTEAPDAPIVLEILTGLEAQAVPYLNPDAALWKRYPGMLAQDFARYVGLVPHTDTPVFEQEVFPSRRVRPKSDAEIQRAGEQELRHFEQSVAYVRRHFDGRN